MSYFAMACSVNAQIKVYFDLYDRFKWKKNYTVVVKLEFKLNFNYFSSDYNNQISVSNDFRFKELELVQEYRSQCDT